MQTLTRIIQEFKSYSGYVRKFNKNVRLLLLMGIFSGLGMGIFSVDFNLYILSLGIDAGQLGKVLSMSPFAQMLAAIPIGFIAEMVGFRKVYVAIFAIAGIMQLMQGTAANLTLLSGAAFLYGLAAAGSFVVKLPYLNANSSPEERTHVFSVDGLLQGCAVAVGALIAGHLPNLLGIFTDDPVLRYRYTLYFAGFLTLCSLVPALFIKDEKPVVQVKLSLKPYLWGMDRFTFKGAVIEFFIGLTMGLIVPFMNVFFIYHMGTTREFFSSVEALVWIPTVIALSIGPLLALRKGLAKSISLARFLIPIFPIVLALTGSPWLGALAYWSYRAIFSMSQASWFSLAMTTSAPKSRVALSAWLEITFQIGMAIAALLTGALLARDNYTLPFFLSAGAALITATLTHLLITNHVKQSTAKAIAD
jgi:MFS family permease